MIASTALYALFTARINQHDYACQMTLLTIHSIHERTQNVQPSILFAVDLVEERIDVRISRVVASYCDASSTSILNLQAETPVTDDGTVTHTRKCCLVPESVVIYALCQSCTLSYALP